MSRTAFPETSAARSSPTDILSATFDVRAAPAHLQRHDEVVAVEVALVELDDVVMMRHAPHRVDLLIEDRGSQRGDAEEPAMAASPRRVAFPSGLTRGGAATRRLDAAART